MSEVAYWKAYRFLWILEPYKSGLTNNERMVYILLRGLWDQSNLHKDQYADEKGQVYCLKTEEEIGETLGIHKDTVRVAIKKLEDLEVLRVYRQWTKNVDGKDYRRNLYYFYPVFHDIKIAAKLIRKIRTTKEPAKPVRKFRTIGEIQDYQGNEENLYGNSVNISNNNIKPEASFESSFRGENIKDQTEDPWQDLY